MALEHRELWRAYWACKSEDARNALVEALLPRALGYARKNVRRVLSSRRVVTRPAGSRMTEDEEAAVALALMHVVEAYDPSLASLGTYMWYRILGAVLDLWRKQGWFTRRFLAQQDHTVRMASLDEMRGDDRAEPERWLPGALVNLAGMSDVEDAVSARDQCLRFLRELRGLDALVIRQRYVEDVAFKDIAKELGVTKQRVCFVHRRALRRLKEFEQKRVE